MIESCSGFVLATLGGGIKTLFHPFGYLQIVFVFVNTQRSLSGGVQNEIIISWAIDVSKCVLECESVCTRKHKRHFLLAYRCCPTARERVLINGASSD